MNAGSIDLLFYVSQLLSILRISFHTNHVQFAARSHGQRLIVETHPSRKMARREHICTSLFNFARGNIAVGSRRQSNVAYMGGFTAYVTSNGFALPHAIDIQDRPLYIEEINNFSFCINIGVAYPAIDIYAAFFCHISHITRTCPTNSIYISPEIGISRLLVSKIPQHRTWSLHSQLTTLTIRKLLV